MWVCELYRRDLRTALGPGQPWHSFGNVYEVASSVVRDLAWGTPYGRQPPCPYGKKTACQLALAGALASCDGWDV